MRSFSFKTIFWHILPALLALGAGILLIKIAYIEDAFEMWALSTTVVCGLFLGVFLLLRPLETTLVYFALSPLLQVLNDASLPVPGSTVTFSFGGVMLTVILICGGTSCLRKPGAPFPEAKKVFSLFLILASWMLITILLNLKDLVILRSLKELGRIMGVFVLFAVGLKYSRGAKEIDKLLFALFGSLLIPVGVAVWQILFGTQYIELENFNRVMGTFGIPNMFGMYLIFPLTVLFQLSFGNHARGVYMPLTWSALLLLMVVLFFTYTRASWLAFLLGSLYMGFRRYKRFIPLIVLPILLLFPLMSPERLRLGSTGSSGRIGLWSALIPAGLSSPVFGHGLMSMPSFSKSLFGFSNQGQNQFLLYWIEGGFVGVMLLGLLLISLFHGLGRCYSQLPEGVYKDFYIAFMAALLGITAIAFFESNAIFQPWVWLPAGVFLGAGPGLMKDHGACCTT
ncbi:MAG: O-antigen ligase family protein [Deltaproteobacteria bacterium]|nr:O-antigen ligase family protein [Deltaproteobacteria bacterium]MBW2017588.1 O-antigen ligase family protein [Deltaproteobacteria bacterium]MBW2130341.1 O-antigen ligase family protein [Deltaproteobacteria bacterium]MBW2304266.1 O-antigen ligase family protein [Deltaproteobacteria bacterium]